MPDDYVQTLRRIAEAVSARLKYEFLCFKGPLMDEAYLIQGVADVLCAVYDLTRYEVKKSIIHPGLVGEKKPGRKPEIDYLVSERAGNKTFDLAIEAKWAGSGYCTDQSILWDLARLKILKDMYPAVTCGFLLAGWRADVNKLFSKGLLKEGTERPLIPDRNRRKTFRLSSNQNHHDFIAKEVNGWASSYPAIAIPSAITTHRQEASSSAHDKLRFVALCWEIS